MTDTYDKSARRVVVLNETDYNALHALVRWEFDAPILLSDGDIDQLSDMQQDILERAGLSDIGQIGFDEDFELEAYTENSLHPDILLQKAE